MTTHAPGRHPPYAGGYQPAAPPAVPEPVGDRAVRSAAPSRRPSRRGLILSVLVVLLGGLVAFGGAQVLTRHTQVLAVSRDVPVGATITDGDLTVANVPSDPNLSPILASQRAQIVGKVARVGLVRGQLLTLAQIGTHGGLADGQMLVALPLKQGQFPIRGMTPGQRVLIVSTPGATGSVAATTGSATGSASSLRPGIDGTVAEVGPINQATQITVIDVQVSIVMGVEVARLASTGNLALLVLPMGRN